MRFWDSSAIVPLLLEEPLTDKMCTLLEEDPIMIVWWTSELECVSALTRLERGGNLDSTMFADALKQLTSVKLSWNEIQPSIKIREIARRFLRVHPLRTADSLQLAAATIAANYRSSKLEFVCNDQQLVTAADREGFAISPNRV